MAVLKKDEFIKKFSEIVGEDNTNDNVLSFYEDISDTFDAYEDIEDWKSKYEENDLNWRRKYRDRFFNDDEGIDIKDTAEGQPVVRTYGSLFDD